MAETNATRTETFAVGIVGVGLTEEHRTVPVGEPPPLPPNAELSVIGRSHPRLDGRAEGHRLDPLYGRRRAARPPDRQDTAFAAPPR